MMIYPYFVMIMTTFSSLRQSLGRGYMPVICSQAAVSTDSGIAGHYVIWAPIDFDIDKLEECLCDCFSLDLQQYFEETRIACCGIYRHPPCLSVLHKLFPFSMVDVSLCDLALQLVLKALARGPRLRLLWRSSLWKTACGIRDSSIHVTWPVLSFLTINIDSMRVMLVL